MPLDQKWREEAEADLKEDFDEEALKDTEEQIRVVARDVEKYGSKAWTEIFAELEAEQKQAFKVMMSTDDEKLLLTAREKARVIASITDRRDKATRELAQLSHQRLVLLGEVAEEE